MSFPITSVMPQTQNLNAFMPQATSGTSSITPTANPASTNTQSNLLNTSTSQTQSTQADATTQADLQQVVSMLATMLMELLGQQQNPTSDDTPSDGGVEPMSAPAASAPVTSMPEIPQSFSSAPAPTIQAPENVGVNPEAIVPANSGTNQGKGITNLSTGEDGAKLDASLQKIANDPDGAKLIAAAEQKGVSIEVGDPAAASGSADKVKDKVTDTAKDGTTVVNGVTLSDADGNTKIVVRDPSNIKTIAHELVHADSTGDGDSQQEEGIADVIGSRIANRIGGTDSGALSGSDEQIYLNKQQYYPNLQQSNDIRSTMAALGISLNV